jgi:hypothetical protein
LGVVARVGGAVGKYRGVHAFVEVSEMLGSLLSYLFASLFGSEVLFSVFLKWLFAAVILFTLPMAFNHIIFTTIQSYQTLVGSAGAGLTSQSFSLTDLAGCIADRVGVVDAFSTIMSWVSVKISLKFIPFLRW